MSKNTPKGRRDSATRTIHASAEEIYDAFSSGQELMKWLPPQDMSGRALLYEFKTGGQYRIELRYEHEQGAGKTTGDSDVSRGQFLELVPGRLIRQSVQFDSDDPGLAEGMTMTWTFEPKGAKTTVKVTADGVPAAIGQSDHLEGLRASLKNLAAFVVQRVVAGAAQKPNPTLSSLEFLVGEWRTEGSHPEAPDKRLAGRASFRWAEGGAFLTMRSVTVNDL